MQTGKDLLIPNREIMAYFNFANFYFLTDAVKHVHENMNPNTLQIKILKHITFEERI